MKHCTMYISSLLSVAFFSGCEKSDFLNIPPDQALVIPSTLTDFQRILDNDHMMNGARTEGLLPALGEMGSDNYYITGDNFVNYINDKQRNIYTWAESIYTGDIVYDWDLPYRSVFYCNTVLDGMAGLPLQPGEEEQANNIKGSALFYRSHMFYQLAQVFAPPYDKLKADTLAGIPLRLQSDVSEPVNRPSLQEVYSRIIEDTKMAAALLPVTPLYKTRPSKPAAYALLARVFLTMGDYDAALEYADSCLQLYNTLLDYNLFNPDDAYPFPRYNDEVIFAANLVFENTVLLQFGTAITDSTLLKSYDENDLRKSLFFQDDGTGNMGFRGSYDGYFIYFGGLAVDEVLLTKAECLARKNDAAGALQTLNTLLEKRWRAGTFKPLTANSAAEALAIILAERRKELVMRGLRWTDLRRLNNDPAQAVTLKRLVNGNEYTLTPNSLRYSYPIPQYVLSFNEGMLQNPR